MEAAAESALAPSKVLVSSDTPGEGHDPKQLVARLKSPTPRPSRDAWKVTAEIEVCDPLLAKRLDEQRKKASPGQVRRVYSKPKPAEPAPQIAAAPAACERDAPEERSEQPEVDSVPTHPAAEEHPEVAEEQPVEPAEAERPPSAAGPTPDDVQRSALTLPMAACAVALVAAAAGLLYARARPAL